MTGKELCDLHVNAFQNILKSQFQEIKGLQSTLLQNKTPIAKADLDSGKVLQIVHMSSHWVACQTKCTFMILPIPLCQLTHLMFLHN